MLAQGLSLRQAMADRHSGPTLRRTSDTKAGDNKRMMNLLRSVLTSRGHYFCTINPTLGAVTAELATLTPVSLPYGSVIHRKKIRRCVDPQPREAQILRVPDDFAVLSRRNRPGRSEGGIKSSFNEASITSWVSSLSLHTSSAYTVWSRSM